jgi:hypothetical protein
MHDGAVVVRLRRGRVRVGDEAVYARDLAGVHVEPCTDDVPMVCVTTISVKRLRARSEVSVARKVVP